MIVIEKKVPKDFNLFLFGDAHVGSSLFSRKSFNKFVDMVWSPYGGLDPNRNFAIDHGDCIEAIMVDDPRYHPENCFNDDGEKIPYPMKQIKDYVELLTPIKEKMIVILDGNHPMKLWRFTNLTRYACEELGVPYGTFAWFQEHKQHCRRSPKKNCEHEATAEEASEAQNGGLYINV